MRYFSRHSALYLKIKEHARIIKTDKKRVKIVFAVLNAVRSTFSETNEFIDSSLEEECEKEGMTADEVIFYKFKSKKIVWANIFVLDLVLKCLFFCL